MAFTGQFYLKGYTSENGVWRLHFENPDPGGGNPSDYYMDIPEAELPDNINQQQLAVQLKQRLGWTLNQTFSPLNQFITAGNPITLP